MGYVNTQRVNRVSPDETKLYEIFGELSEIEHYEIHVTVKSNNKIIEFKQACEALGVKPLVVQLSEGKVPDDVMTSSHFTGTPWQLRRECRRIVTWLEAGDWDVVRCKVECSPFHHKVVDLTPEKILPFQYFESHIPVRFRHDEPMEEIRAFCKLWGLHLSANAFKIHDDERTVMITYRSSYNTADRFRKETDGAVQTLLEMGYRAQRPVVEFALFDSNKAHDDAWTKR